MSPDYIPVTVLGNGNIIKNNTENFPAVTELTFSGVEAIKFVVYEIMLKSAFKIRGKNKAGKENIKVWRPH